MKDSERIVLVGVLKNKRDLEILKAKKWYRIPLEHAPVRRFDYLAFYQPENFGRGGKQIKYFAKIKMKKIFKRSELLPDELNHPRTHEDYLKYSTTKLEMLPRPIKNIIPRRVNFGFTTLERLKNSKNILELYSIAPTEQILESALRAAGLDPISQKYVMIDRKTRFRPDLIVQNDKVKIAIECDNKKAHSGKKSARRDERKNNLLHKAGYSVLRFDENEILFNLKECIRRIEVAGNSKAGPKLFSQKVLAIVRQIPKGETMTYKQVAIKAGSPRAHRAVGNILNQNFDSSIPCHRVIRSDGTTGGYNRGGKLKAKLLKQESDSKNIKVAPKPHSRP